MKTIWVSVGEVSGDIHASHVVQQLRILNPSLHIRGIGGSHLQNAGMECVFSISLLSVMGIWEVIKKSFTIWKLLRAIKKDFQKSKPDALLVVDAPSFNFLLIKLANKMGIPVYYYIIPKVWASRPRRVHFLARFCRRLFCIFPFEVEWLNKYGVKSLYVGNPLVSYLQPILEKHYQPQKNSIIFMPGSRKSEIERLMPLFIDVAKILLNKNPQLQFSYILAPSIQKEMIDIFIPQDIEIKAITPEYRYHALAQASLTIVASGTATLETTLLGIPTIVTYKLSSLSAYIMKKFITIPFVSLPNIVMNQAIIPELLQENATPENIATTALPLLQNTQERERMLEHIHSLYQVLYTKHNPALLVAQQILEDMHSI